MNNEDVHSVVAVSGGNWTSSRPVKRVCASGIVITEFLIERQANFLLLGSKLHTVSKCCRGRYSVTIIRSYKMFIILENTQ